VHLGSNNGISFIKLDGIASQESWISNIAMFGL